MSIFKRDREIKRMIFNVYADLAERLEAIKAEARQLDKRLDVDTAVNKALDKFVKKAEKKLEELRREDKEKPRIHTRAEAGSGLDSEAESGAAAPQDPEPAA